MQEERVVFWTCSQCGKSIPPAVKHCFVCEAAPGEGNRKNWQTLFPGLQEAVAARSEVTVWIEGGICFEGVPLHPEGETVRLLSSPSESDGPTIDIQISKIAALVVQHRQSERIEGQEELDGAEPQSSEPGELVDVIAAESRIPRP